MRLFPLTSLHIWKATNVNKIKLYICIRPYNGAGELTYKYHRPVSWHISGDKVPVSELPLKPLRIKRTEMLPSENIFYSTQNKVL